MKKNVNTTVTLVVTGLIFLGMSENKAHAGNKEWATVGKILTGIIGAQIVYDIIDSDYGYTTQTTHRQRSYRHRRSNPRMIIETTRVYESPETIIETTRVYEKKRSRKNRHHRRSYRHTRRDNHRRYSRRHEYRDNKYSDYEFGNYENRSHKRKKYCGRY